MSFYKEIVNSTKSEREFRLGLIERNILEKSEEGEFELTVKCDPRKDEWLIDLLEEEEFKVRKKSDSIVISWYEEGSKFFYNDVRNTSEKYKEKYLENVKQEIRLASKNCMEKISTKYRNILFAKYCQEYFLKEGFRCRIENEYLIVEWDFKFKN